MNAVLEVPGGLAATSAARLVMALAGALALIVVAERRHLRDLASRVLFVRWRTWAITAPLFGAAVLGPVAAGIVFVAALSLQGVREYAGLVDLPRSWRRGLVLAALASAPLAALAPAAWRALPPVLFLGATSAVLLRRDVRHGVRNLAWSVLGYTWIPLLLGYFLLIREHIPGGRGLLLAVGTSVAISDVAAFAAGSLTGRHPLAPALSPAKTWEGVGGNVLGAYLGFALMGFAVPDGLPTAVRLLLPAVVAVGCVWGDLVESLFKRHCGTKDAGTCLPGFGGILDRIDSLLVALPLAYTVVAGLR